ncbi:MAG: hypothetical protein ACKOCE_04965 [Acidimicrobiia bacterium]
MEARPDRPPVARHDVRRWLSWLPVAGLAIPFVVLLIQQFSELGDRRLPCCDYSALELGTRAFLRGEQLTGSYSRGGWRHPGPITFVWSAVARLLPGHGFAEHQVATVAVHMAALGAVVAVLRRRLSDPGFAVSVTVLAVWVWRFDIDQFREPWNPFTAMSWTMAAVAISVAFATRIGWGALVAFAVVGSFAVQTHVGSAPVVVLATVLVARTLRARWADPGRVGAVRRVLMVGTVIWTLPLVDLMFGDHNMLDVATGTERGWSVGDPWLATLRLLGAGPSAMGRYFGPESPYVTAHGLGVSEVAGVVIAVLLSALVYARRDRQPFAFQVSALSWAGVLVTAMMLQTTAGPFYRYLLLPVVGLSALIWVVGVAVLVETIASDLPPIVVPLVAVLATSVIGVVTAVGVDSEHLVGRYGNDSIERSVRAVEGMCDSLPEEVVVEVSDAGGEMAWTEAMPVIVALDRCTSVSVVGVSGFIAGPGFAADADAVPNYRISGTGWSAVAAD